MSNELISLLVLVLIFLIGVGLLISPAPTELAVAMMIMSGFAALRIVHRDVAVDIDHRAADEAQLVGCVELQELVGRLEGSGGFLADRRDHAEAGSDRA
mgnify:CR=1 FL=1